jgi:hypothetical protein
MRLSHVVSYLGALAVLAATDLTAQSTPPSTAANAIIFQFARFADIYGSRLAVAFDSIPASKYDFRPTPVQQTVGYIAQHLEKANYGLCEQLSALKRTRTAKDSLADSIKARWPKDTLVARLKASLHFCDDALDRVPELNSPALAATLLGFETDLAEHYSQISSYMRLLGLVPPSALPPAQHATIKLSDDAMRPFVGTYEITTGQTLSVTLADDALAISSNIGGGAVPALPISAVEFFARDADARITFTKGASGSVTGLVLHQYGRDRIARKVK